MVKIGSVAFNSMGHKIIRFASEKGFEIFLDLKLHDIPNTVKKSIQGLTSLPINMLTIHTLRWQRHDDGCNGGGFRNSNKSLWRHCFN